MAQIATSNDSNQLLQFVNTASTNIQARMQEALKGKAKKVNHRKYIQKRLQNGKPSRKTATSKLPTTQTTSQVGRQPIASFSSITVSDCERLCQYVPSPKPLANTRQGSQEQYDPEIDSILSEMGMYPDLSMDSPSQSSLYSDTTDEVCRTFSNASSGSLPQIPDYYAFSPNSDFSYSDVDDSAYSSPRNASPICGYSPPVAAVSTSAQYYQQPQTWDTLTTSLMLDLYEYTA